MSRVWQRVRGGAPGDDRQTRWWDERRGASAGADYSGGARPESEPGARVTATATRIPRQRAEVEAPRTIAVSGARRPALPAGSGGVGADSGRPTWGDPTEVDDRAIYRRDDSVPVRPGSARPVQAELVDGVPVYRIYRPRPSRSGGG